LTKLLIFMSPSYFLLPCVLTFDLLYDRGFFLRTFLTAPALDQGIREADAARAAALQASRDQASVAASAGASATEGADYAAKGGRNSADDDKHETIIFDQNSDGAGASTDAAAAAAPVAKKRTSSWFSLPSSISMPSLKTSSKKIVSMEPTPEDKELTALSAEVSELEANTLAAYKALQKNSQARVDQCSQFVRWTNSLVLTEGLPPAASQAQTIPVQVVPEAPTASSAGSGGGGGSGAALMTEVDADDADERPSDVLFDVSDGIEPKVEGGDEEEEGTPAAATGTVVGVAKTSIAGVSPQFTFFGDGRQKWVASAAQKEHSALKKALTDRVLVLGSAKDALGAREQLRNDLLSVMGDAVRRTEQLEGAVVKEGAARAKAAQGKGGKDADKLEALSVSRTKDKEDAQDAKAKADATVSLTKSKLNEATERMKREWARVNKSWGVQCKAALLEAARTNQALHQSPLQALQALHDTISREQAEERASAALEAEQAEGAAAAAVEERRQAAEAKAAELEKAAAQRKAVEKEAHQARLDREAVFVERAAAKAAEFAETAAKKKAEEEAAAADGADNDTPDSAAAAAAAPPEALAAGSAGETVQAPPESESAGGVSGASGGDDDGGAGCGVTGGASSATRDSVLARLEAMKKKKQKDEAPPDAELGGSTAALPLAEESAPPPSSSILEGEDNGEWEEESL
jgi:hypothetical protein